MKKKIIILSITIAIGVVAAGGVYFLYPQYQLYQKYQTAIETYEAGDVAGAITQFQNLNGFYDSKEWVQKCEYTFAEQYIAENNYDEAFAIYETYQDADNMNQCQYQKAVYCSGQKNYQEALAIFQNLTGYEDADEQAKNCNYNIALNYFDKKKYSKALAIFKQLGNYKHSQDNIQNCYKKLKYSRFDYDGFREMLCDHASSKSDLKKLLESMLADNFQLTWYEGNSQNQMIINQSTINDKPYGIISYQDGYDGDWVTYIKYFYFDNPKKELECVLTHNTDYSRVTDVNVCDMKFENKNYCTVENTVKEEIQSELAILEQQDEAEQKKDQLLSAIYDDIKKKTEYHFGNRTVLDRTLDPLEFKFPSLDNVFIVEGNNAIQMQFTVGYRSAYDAILDDIIGGNLTYCTVTATYSVDYDTLTYKQMDINYTAK